MFKLRDSRLPSVLFGRLLLQLPWESQRVRRKVCECEYSFRIWYTVYAWVTTDRFWCLFNKEDNNTYDPALIMSFVFTGRPLLAEIIYKYCQFRRQMRVKVSWGFKFVFKQLSHKNTGALHNVLVGHQLKDFRKRNAWRSGGYCSSAYHSIMFHVQADSWTCPPPTPP